jgi:hypothetical protein
MHTLTDMSHILMVVRYVMETPWSLGTMSFILVFVPILGMWAVHKYNWQHWAPFDRDH